MTRLAMRALVVVVTLLECGPGTPPPCGTADAGACDAQSEPAPTCDPSKDPKDDPLCVSDALGICVSPNGDDAHPGTKELPVQTIAKAISLTETVKRIYVCEGTYAEDVSIAPPADGISLFGGFSCADWSYTGTKAQLGKSNLALAITATHSPITIEDVYVRAATGELGNPSSIAALVANATGTVTFRRVSLNAGSGVAGPDGVTGSNYDATLVPTDPKIKGIDATGGGAGFGAAQPCSALCSDGKASAGGAGGRGGTSALGGATGSATPVITGLITPNDGAGGTADTGAGCTAGDHGGDATLAGLDAPSPTTLGALVASGWNASTSPDGANGGTGEGGGGGGGAKLTDDTHGGGGGGACGGCGGAGGAAGVGGGSSIALAILSSPVTVVASELHAGDGANGGTGVGGQIGQSGGVGGAGSAPGCAGGFGGRGSAGGTGAGGVGGSSVAVLYTGTVPTLDSSTQGAMTFGAKGLKGIGGKPGVNDGIDGVAMTVHQLP